MTSGPDPAHRRSGTQRSFELHSISPALLTLETDPPRLDVVLQDIVIQLLTADDPVDRSVIEACERMLQSELPAATQLRALRVLIAVQYRAPEHLSGVAVGALKNLLVTPRLRGPNFRLASRLLQYLMLGKLASDVVDSMCAVLKQRGPDEPLRSLLEIVSFAASWRMDLLSFDRLLPLLQSPHLRDQHPLLLPLLAERLLFADPAAITPAHLQSLLALFADLPDFRYFLSYLAARPAASPASRHLARRHREGRFPIHDPIHANLGSGPKRVLIVQNARGGQGDELLALVPLLEALLAFNPILQIALITNRTYLYDHPRLRLIPIRRRDQVRAHLAPPCDALILYRGSDEPGKAIDPELEHRIADRIATHPPALLITTQVAGTQLHCDRLDVNGVAWAAERGLDRSRTDNVYEPTFRLIAELGLPLRAGEEPPTPGSVLVGLPHRQAEAVWQELIGPNLSGDHRPVAVVNPFGGSHRLKGFVEENLADLAEQIGALIREGYFVVLLPSGTPWGRATHARRAVAMLPVQEQRHVVVALDPESRRVRRTIGPFSSAWVMRMYKYFTWWADLVVTVEGWLMHLAYSLGKPCRVVLAPQSGSFAFLPYGRTLHQDVVRSFSPLMPATRPDPSPLLLFPPRKDLFIVLLRQLEAAADPRALPIIRRALLSPDAAIRGPAARALAAMPDEEVEVDLLALLDDPAGNVRGTAAAALLAHHEGTPDRLPVPREHLQALAAMRPAKPDWSLVQRLGEAGLPALIIASRDEVPSVRRKARRVLATLKGKPLAEASP
jgi:hypothetical protein